MTRICKRCRTAPVDGHGLHLYCKPCRRLIRNDREKAWRTANPDAYRAKFTKQNRRLGHRPREVVVAELNAKAADLVARIEALISAGRTPEEAGHEVGKSKNAVIGLLYRAKRRKQATGATT